jgi:hypothetical protein
LRGDVGSHQNHRPLVAGLTAPVACVYIAVSNQFNVKVNRANKEDKHEILKFSDMDPGYKYEVPSQLDATYGAADMADDSLQEFFSRPVKIQSYSWGTGTNLFETFNPWKNFFENDRVINRITNYHLLRCKLHVKFVINGNGFHYGRAICSYIPLHTSDDFTKVRTFFQQDVVSASQRPHVYLDPTNSQGGEVVLPFVWKYNSMDIPEQDWNDMGAFSIIGMQDLKHANGASDSVTVSVFVWATDVKLAVPTANEPGALSPQAGEYLPQADEYGTGVVSKPASIIARAAGALSTAPVIGAYARATEIGASAVARIASAFGYSRPVVCDDVVPYRPTYAGNMANTNVADSSTKLTYDIKQESTVDTRTMGLDGTDEMTLKSIATRESYLTEFPWLVSDTTETLLWNTEVCPIVWSELSLTTTEYHMPACCFAGLPFEHWRGTMKFRFQIVASAFHKGRLKIVYDPSYPLTNEYNTNYTRIIDIAEERDFTVEIGWGSQYPYLRHRDMVTNGGPIFQTTALGADPGQFANGILSVYTVNELTVPNSTANNDIAINVFVSAGDDIEFANPTEEYIEELSWYVPQSGEYTPQAGEENVPDADNTMMENAPTKLEPDENMAAELTCTDHTNDIYFGDPVASIRQLLKRYCFSTVWSPAALGWRIHTWNLPDMPLHRGYDPNGIHTATGPVNYNYAKMTLLNYFTPAFVCYRGGTRWKYVILGEDDITNGSPVVHGLLQVTRRPEVDAYQYGSAEFGSNSVTQSAMAADYVVPFRGSSAGANLTQSRFNPVNEAEIPYYENERFKYGKNGDYVTSGSDVNFHGLNATFNANSSSHVAILAYCAAAEDYTLGFYTGPPVAYRVIDPAAV